MRINLFCVFIATCFNVVFTSEDSVSDDDYHESSIQAKAAGRAYSVSSCNYKLQVGYSCLSCNRALHCYPGDIAILVDCYGMFRFCRDGRCSRFQGEKCLPGTKLTTPPSNDTILHTVPENIPYPNSQVQKQVTGAVENMTVKTADEVTEKNAEIVTEKLNVDTQVSTKKALSVTETVIIPIDDATVKESDERPTDTSEEPSSNVV